MLLSEIKTALRNGPYAWSGGYPLYFITDDGDTLSFAAVREEWRAVVWSHLIGMNGGWHIQAVDINYEDDDLVCAHKGQHIPSAYGGQHHG